MLCAVFGVPERTEQVDALLRERDAFVDGKLVGKRYFPEVVPQQVAPLLGIPMSVASLTFENVENTMKHYATMHPELASFVKTGTETA